VDGSESEFCVTPCTVVSIAGFILGGILLFFLGMNYTNNDWEFMPMDTYAYNMVKMVLSLILLIFAAYAFRKMVLIEGLILFFISISSLTFAVTYLIYSETGISMIDLVFGLALLGISIQTRRNKDWVLFASTLMAGMGFALSGLGISGPLEGIFLMVSGIILASYGALQMMVAEISPNAIERNPSHVMVTESVGMFLLGIMCLIVGLWYIDNVISIWTQHSNSYNIAKIILSLTIIIFSFYAIFEGEFATGIAMMLFGVSAASFSFSQLLFGESRVELVDVIFGVVFFVSVVSLYFRKEKLKSLAFFLLFFAITFYPLFGGDAKYYVIGIPFILAALVIMFLSVTFSSNSGLKVFFDKNEPN
jgi:hypothetical protein